MNVRALWIARCMIFSQNVALIPLAIESAPTKVDTIETLYDLGLDSELEVRQETRTNDINGLLSSICDGVVGIFHYDDGQAYCVGTTFIADATTGACAPLQGSAGAITSTNERVTVYYLRVLRQRLDKKRPLKKLKRCKG